MSKVILKSEMLNELENRKIGALTSSESKKVFDAYDIVSEMSDEVSADDFAKLMAKHHFCPSLFSVGFKCREQEYFSARCESCWQDYFKYPNLI